jgi:hypothetical protein
MPLSADRGVQREEGRLRLQRGELEVRMMEGKVPQFRRLFYSSLRR